MGENVEEEHNFWRNASLQVCFYSPDIPIVLGYNRILGKNEYMNEMEKVDPRVSVKDK